MRVRHSDRFVSKRFPNWKELSKEQLVLIYKELVEDWDLIGHVGAKGGAMFGLDGDLETIDQFQVGGSVIRPASYCGNFALKPTQGGINRGERQATSMSTSGIHAGSIEDMWQVAIEIARRAGGDPGRPALSGPPTPPAARSAK